MMLLYSTGSLVTLKLVLYIWSADGLIISFWKLKKFGYQLLNFKLNGTFKEVKSSFETGYKIKTHKREPMFQNITMLRSKALWSMPTPYTSYCLCLGILLLLPTTTQSCV